MEWTDKNKKLIKLAVALGKDLSEGMTVEEAADKYGINQDKLESIAKDLSNLYTNLQSVKVGPAKA